MQRQVWDTWDFVVGGWGVLRGVGEDGFDKGGNRMI